LHNLGCLSANSKRGDIFFLSTESRLLLRNFYVILLCLGYGKGWLLLFRKLFVLMFGISCRWLRGLFLPPFDSHSSGLKALAVLHTHHEVLPPSKLRSLDGAEASLRRLVLLFCSALNSLNYATRYLVRPALMLFRFGEIEAPNLLSY